MLVDVRGNQGSKVILKEPSGQSEKRAEDLRPARVYLPCYTGFDEVQLREPGKDRYR